MEFSKAKMITTKDVQRRIYDNKVQKGFNVTNLSSEFCLLYGEVAEAYDANRKNKDINELAEELADIVIYALGIAEIKGIDLGAAIDKKMEINEKRKYKKVNGTFIKESEKADWEIGEFGEMGDYFEDGMK